MKGTFLAAGILLTVASFSVCAEWVKVKDADIANLYFDPTSVKRNGDLRRVWELTDVKATNVFGMKSSRSLSEYDCKTDRTRTLAIATFTGQMAAGNLIERSDVAGDWQYIAPGAVSDIILKRVCLK